MRQKQLMLSQLNSHFANKWEMINWLEGKRVITPWGIGCITQGWYKLGSLSQNLALYSEPEIEAKMVARCHTDGPLWIEEIGEFEIWVAGECIGYAELDGEAQEMYLESLRIRRKHVERGNP